MMFNMSILKNKITSFFKVLKQSITYHIKNIGAPRSFLVFYGSIMIYCHQRIISLRTISMNESYNDLLYRFFAILLN